MNRASLAQAAQGARRLRDAARAGILRVIDALANEEQFNVLPREQLAVNLRAIQRHWEVLEEKHRVLVGGTDDAEAIAANEAYYVEIEQRYMQCEARIEARLRAQRVQAPVVEANPREIVVRQVREPRVGTFNGRHEEWASFSNLFRVEVDERRDLDAVQKLVYLTTACVDMGKRALGEWPITAANYPLAWAALQAKFNDRYATKARLMAKVYRLQKQTDETYDGLRTLLDVTQVSLRQLEDMGEPTNQWDLPIVQLLLFKAPRSVAENYERERRNDVEPTMRHFFDWLEARARSRMILENAEFDKQERLAKRKSNKAEEQPRPNQDNGQQKSAENNGQRNGNFQRPNQNNGQPRWQLRSGRNSGQENKAGGSNNGRHMVCWSCDGSHSLYDCPGILKMSAEQRQQELSAKGVCIRCGRKHFGECHTPKDCGVCDKQQHIDLVCPKKVYQGSRSNGDSRKRKAGNRE